MKKLIRMFSNWLGMLTAGWVVPDEFFTHLEAGNMEACEPILRAMARDWPGDPAMQHAHRAYVEAHMRATVMTMLAGRNQEEQPDAPARFH